MRWPALTRGMPPPPAYVSCMIQCVIQCVSYVYCMIQCVCVFGGGRRVGGCLSYKRVKPAPTHVSATSTRCVCTRCVHAYMLALSVHKHCGCTYTLCVCVHAACAYTYIDVHVHLYIHHSANTHARCVCVRTLSVFRVSARACTQRVHTRRSSRGRSTRLPCHTPLRIILGFRASRFGLSAQDWGLRV